MRTLADWYIEFFRYSYSQRHCGPSWRDIARYDLRRIRELRAQS